jgi:hypothetical protein
MRELVFALDADAAGQQQWRTLARQAVLRKYTRRALAQSESIQESHCALAAWVLRYVFSIYHTVSGRQCPGIRHYSL